MSPGRAPTPPIPSVRELFVAHGKAVWRLLRRLGIRDADVDDVCQEVFVVVHRKLPSFERRSSVKTWLFGIAVRVASDHQKRAYVRREQLEAPSEAPTDDAISGEAEIDRRRALSRLDAALLELKPEQRSVVVLYEIEGLSMPEVADVLACPVQTAYSRLKSAHRKLRAELAASAQEVA